MDPDLSPRLRAELLKLAIDVATVEVMGALSQAGIPSILLKGPAMATWLYDDPQERDYSDVDLLLPSTSLRRAHEVASSLGFEYYNLEVVPGRPSHHDVYLRDVRLELHRTLIGVGVPDDVLWHTLGASTEAISLNGEEIDILDEPSRLVVLVLHAAQHGVAFTHLMDEVERALERVSQSVWDDAIELADRLDANEAFRVGLRLIPAGRALADQKGLSSHATLETKLIAASAPPGALALEWLRHAGWRWRIAFIARKFALPADAMRALYPLARRGRAGLAGAYLLRPIWLLRRLPRAYRARKDARG